MDQLTWEIWDTILKQLDTLSILRFAEAISKNRQLQMLRSWLNTRPVPLRITDYASKRDYYYDNDMTYEEFKKIAKILKWDLKIELTEHSPLLIDIQQNIHSLNCKTKDLSYIEDQLISKLVNLELFDFTKFDNTTLSKFVNLRELCLYPSSDFIEIDLQNLSKLRSLEIKRLNSVSLVSLPASLKLLDIWGSLDKSSINTNLNLKSLKVSDCFYSSAIESLLYFCGQSLLELYIGYAGLHNENPQVNPFMSGYLTNLCIPNLILDVGIGNEVNPGIETLKVEHWMIDPSNPIVFNGTCLEVADFFDSDYHLITLDCDLSMAKNLQNFKTESELSKFPDFANNIVSITIVSPISHVPTLENLTNLKYLNICFDSHEVIINPPNLHELVLYGDNISKLIVNDSIKELDLFCDGLSSLEHISCFNTNEFPRLISSLSVSSSGFKKIEQIQFPKSLRTLYIYGSKELITIQNVTFEAGSHLNEFDLSSNANVINVILPSNTKYIELVSDKSLFDFESFKIPKYVEKLHSEHYFGEETFSPILNISFQQLKYLKTLTLKHIRLLTTVNSPVLLPNTLEDLYIYDCITDTIDLKFQSGVTNLRSLSFRENLTSTSNGENKIFPTFTYKSIGHDKNTSHDFLQKIVSNTPPGNLDLNDHVAWCSPNGPSSSQIHETSLTIFTGSPKELRLVRVIGCHEPIDFINPNLQHLRIRYRPSTSGERPRKDIFERFPYLFKRIYGW